MQRRECKIKFEWCTFISSHDLDYLCWLILYRPMCIEETIQNVTCDPQDESEPGKNWRELLFPLIIESQRQNERTHYSQSLFAGHVFESVGLVGIYCTFPAGVLNSSLNILSVGYFWGVSADEVSSFFGWFTVTKRGNYFKLLNYCNHLYLNSWLLVLSWS